MMESGWHWFVIAGVVVSLAAMLWLLLANRTISGNETTGHDWDGIEELDNPLPMWWVGMFVATIVFSIIYLVIYPGAGNVTGALNWTSANQHQAEVEAHEARFAPLYTKLARMDEAALVADRQAMQVGRRLFLNNCSTCHGVNANGSFGFPNLTDEEWLWGSDFDAIKTTLTYGRVAQMAPWGAALGDEGVTNVANYVLKLAGKPHDEAAAEAGITQFNTMCVVCHGADGKGNKLFGAPDLTNDIWLYGGNIEQLTFTIANGRQGNMPAQKDILDEEKIHIVSAYVRSLSQ